MIERKCCVEGIVFGINEKLNVKGKRKKTHHMALGSGLQHRRCKMYK
jgi:hypothetical protein